MAQINGRKVPATDGKTIAQYIEEVGYGINSIAVECNGKIVSKKDYESSVLKESDIVEVVTFVGGG